MKIAMARAAVQLVPTNNKHDFCGGPIRLPSKPLQLQQAETERCWNSTPPIDYFIALQNK
jgi:hypothetical protein